MLHKIITIVVLSFLFLVLSASIIPQTSYAVFGVGVNCNANGHPGICRDRNTTSCPTYYDSGNFCPGGASIQCCVNSQVACYPPGGSGTCHNAYNGNVSCNGSFNPGNYCPGPQDVQCCVPPPPPPPPPPPTNVTASCPLPGTSVTVNWTPVSGYPYYYARILDQTTSTECLYSGVITGSSFSCNTAIPGHTYSSWVHTTNAAGNPYSTAIYGTPVTCPIPKRFNQSTTTPGILFTGNGSSDFGLGRASVPNWVVGGLNYPEVYQTASNNSPTSYQYLLDKTISGKTTVTNLTNVPGCNDLNNCTLPANLANGIYQANANLNLQGYTFPAGKNYIFLINGNLNILGNIVTPNGSTAIFSAKNDIIIDKNVGTATNFFPLPAGQIQGIFSADRNFTINGIGDCIVGKDKMLNVEGAIITNARGIGGNFQNQRDLCGDNPNYPSLTLRLRLDFLLNAPTFIQKQSTTIREDAP